MIRIKQQYLIMDYTKELKEALGKLRKFVNKKGYQLIKIVSILKENATEIYCCIRRITEHCVYIE